jgi:1-acyl-sn-glycerol-3-phosphate acyltransferase
MLLVAWHRRFGTTRPPYCLAHRWLYETRFLRVAVPKIGGIRASWRNARQVLAAGHALSIFPGGEQESTRPFSERYRVALYGRKGFVRLAFASDVPIVPFVTIGSHATMILPPGMHFLAAVTGARRYFGLEAIPLPLQALVWLLAGLAFGGDYIGGWLFALLLLATPPLYPSKIVTVYGAPITPAELLARTAAAQSPIDAGYLHVEAVMQRMMDDLAAERRWLFS